MTADVAPQEIVAAAVQNAITTTVVSNEINTAVQQNRAHADIVGNVPLATVAQNRLDVAVVQNQMVISSAVVDESNDPSLLLVICDGLGQPLIDGTGQYIIAG